MRLRRPVSRLLVLVFTAVLGTVTAHADWPQFQADASRSAYTPEVLDTKLSAWWEYDTRTLPDPAWEGMDTRMPFDHVYHLVASGGLVVFGSSADCGIHALDASKGTLRWTYTTDAPVRLAPAMRNGKVYAVSDDGYLYCLDARTGKMLWSKQNGPKRDMVLGNDRLISRWPARGGIALADGMLYYAAGIWPSETIYLNALNPETGDEIWTNAEAGGIEIDQPHPTARAKSGISAQGYLVVASDRLLVPTGRAVPAAFDRDTGSLLFFHLQANRAAGGSALTALGDYFLNNGTVFQTSDGVVAGGVRSAAEVVSPECVYTAEGSTLTARAREGFIVERETTDRKGNKATKKSVARSLWSLTLPSEGACGMAGAGDVLAVGHADGTVCLVDTGKGEVVWKDKVDGAAQSLAAAEGRLYVSTSSGKVFCFGPKRRKRAQNHGAPRSDSPYPRNPDIAKAAEEIVRQSGVTEGFCADLGCGNGQLAYELATRTNLVICAADPDLDNVRDARERLAKAGLHGTRVTVHQAAAGSLPHPDYFADLVVSGRAAQTGEQPYPAEEVLRVTRPYGGASYIGKPGAMKVAVRGGLDGAGTWTHQYCTPANTCSSQESRVKGPLKMLWFRDSDFRMPSRHGRGPAPLFNEGRLFVEGLDALRAVNAYNGRPLWEYPMPNILKPYDQEHLVGTAGTNSNFCIEDGVVYVRREGECILLDAATGQELGRHNLPGGKGAWGYIACVDGTLYGSRVNEDHIVKWAYRKSDMSQIFTESDLFFAMDAATGKVKWRFTPKYSIRHNAIALGQGKVFIIDRPLDEGDRLDAEELAARRGKDAPKPPKEPARLLALDIKNGSPLWEASDDIYGTLLALSVDHDLLLMTQQYTRFHLASERGGKMTTFRASTGERVWDAPSDPQGKASRPIIIGETVYNEPGAWNLLTGERLDFHLDRSYGCGIIAAGKNLLVYRSATFGYFDLLKNEGTINYGGVRPGCWINAIPAGGLVLMPDATDRCTCSYLIKTNVALQPAG